MERIVHLLSIKANMHVYEATLQPGEVQADMHVHAAADSVLIKIEREPEGICMRGCVRKTEKQCFIAGAVQAAKLEEINLTSLTALYAVTSFEK